MSPAEAALGLHSTRVGLLATVSHLGFSLALRQEEHLFLPSLGTVRAVGKSR